MKCEKCGTENIEGVSSCKECGFVFKQNMDESKPVATAINLKNNNGENDNLNKENLEEVFCECGQKLNYEDTKCPKCDKDISKEKKELLKKIHENNNTFKYIIVFYGSVILSIILLFNTKKTLFIIGLLLLTISMVTSIIGKIKHPDDSAINVIFILGLIIMSIAVGFLMLIAACIETISSCPG